MCFADCAFESHSWASTIEDQTNAVTADTSTRKWLAASALTLALWLPPFGDANAHSGEEPSQPSIGELRSSAGEQKDASRPQEDLEVVDVSPRASNNTPMGANEKTPSIESEAFGSVPPPPSVTLELQATESNALAYDVETSEAAVLVDDTGTGATIRVAENGLHVKSADGRAALGLTVFLQMGYRQVASDFEDSNNSGFALEHFRPILAGKYTEFLSYNFQLRITPSIVRVLNAVVIFHLHPRLNMRVGLQKPIFGSEHRQAQYAMLFVNRSMVCSIGPTRDLGLALDFRPIDDLRIEAGVYNGTEDNKVFSGIQDRSIGGDAGVRWFLRGQDHPTAKEQGFLTVGAVALLRRNEGDSTISHLTPRSSAGGHVYSNYVPGVYADGRKFASAIFAHGGHKGLYFLSEFTTSNQQVSDGVDQGRIVEHAWQLSASYTVGGVTSWAGTTPHRTLFEGGLGALQFKVRGHGLSARSRNGNFLDLDGRSADSLSAIGASTGLSWHISSVLRLQADYNWTTFGADTKRLVKANEHVLFIGMTAGY